MYKVEVTKVKGSPYFIGEPINGEVPSLPKIGEQFLVLGPNCPLLVTTQIQHIENIGNEYRIQTLNSIYKIVVKGE